MGRTQVFQGVELVIPDAYSDLDLDALLTPTSGGVGIVALIGESDGGKPGITVFPGGAPTSVVKNALKSGPGANGSRLALRSGSDDLVRNGASTVLFAKTNNSTQGAAAIGSPTKLTLVSKQYGVFVNAYTASIVSMSGGAILTVRENSPAANSIVESSPLVGNTPYFSVAFAGTATPAVGSLHYVSGVLRYVTTLTSPGTGEVSLSIDCTGLTVNQLVNMINQNPGYTATVLNQFGQVLVSSLDLVVTPASLLTAGQSYFAGIYELTNWAASTSQLVTVTRTAGDAGDKVPAPFPASGVVTFTGGTRGTTANSDVQNMLNALLALRVNIVVPLFSSDSQDGSTVTIAAVNAQVKDHVDARSSLLGRSEAQAYVSVKGNKTVFEAMAASMGDMLVAVTSQAISDLDIDGNIITYDEWGFAVVCAQTQAGSAIGTPLENRIIPVQGISNDVSWSFITDGPELIKKGTLYAIVDENNEIRIKGGYTSWLGDSNNARIYIETVESLLIFSFNHRQFMKQKFLGKSVFTTGDILAAISESQGAERDTTKSIKGFDSTQTKLVSTTAGRLEYNLAVIPWEGIRFILPTVVAIREAA